MYPELRPERKYTIECPMCRDGRQKRNTKTLTVYNDPDGFTRWQCNHAGQCDWNERQYMKTPDHIAKRLDESDSYNDVYEPSHTGVQTSDFLDGHRVWWYRDLDGSPIFGCLRYNGTKVYSPVLIRGNTFLYGKDAQWPKNKVLFNQDYIKDHNTVIVVEGEKAAEAGQKLFTKAAVVSWRGGANNISSGNWDLLKGKDIILWPDNDKPGKDVMERIAEHLPVRSYKVAYVDHLPPKSDLADNLSRDDIARAIREAQDCKKESSGLMTFEDLVEQHNHLNNRLVVGIPAIDDNIKLPMSGYVVLEGRTKHGKSAFGIYLTRSILDTGGRVVYFSYEIPASRVVARYVRTRDPHLAIEEVYASPAIEPIKKAIQDERLVIYDQSSQLNINALLDLLDDPKWNGSVVVIDYIQIVPIPGADRQQAIKNAVDKLRVLANKHGFIIFLLSQITPNMGNPLLDVPREAKDIHYSAEAVIRLWYKDNELVHPTYQLVAGNYTAHVLYNRDGEAGHFLGFDFSRGAHFEFTNDVVDRLSTKSTNEREEVSAKDVKELVKAIKGFADAVLVGKAPF